MFEGHRTHRRESSISGSPASLWVQLWSNEVLSFGCSFGSCNPFGGFVLRLRKGLILPARRNLALKGCTIAEGSMIVEN